MKIQVLVGAMILTVSVCTEADWLEQELKVLEITNQQRNLHDLDALNGDNRLREAAFGHSQSMSEYNFFSHTTLAGPNAAEAGQRILNEDYNWNRPAPGTIGAWGENIAAGQGYGFDGVLPTEFEPIDAARDVMFGTADLDKLSDFDRSLGLGGFASWEEVGDIWDDSDWDAWGDGWMGSDGHRGNILSDLFTDLGIGYVWEPGDQPPIRVDDGFDDFPLRTYWTQNFAAGDSDPAQFVPLPAGFWLFGSALIAGFGLIRRRDTA